jgi:hypothetical protein
MRTLKFMQNLRGLRENNFCTRLFNKSLRGRNNYLTIVLELLL